MRKGFNIILVILSLFYLISIALFGILYSGFIATDRLNSSEQQLLLIKNKIFDKTDLGLEIEFKEFIEFENLAKLTLPGFKGLRFSKNSIVLFQSDAIKDLNSSDWKKYNKSTTANAKKAVTISSWDFVNPSTNHEITFFIKLIDNETIKTILLITLFALAIYLSFLVIILLVLLLNKNGEIADIKNEIDQDNESQENEFILSLNCLQQFDAFLETATKNSEAFSIAVLKIANDIFNEEKYDDGFTLLRTHIKFNSGYYENNNHQMILLLPDTGLKEAIKLLEEFTARFIENNIDVNLNCGITSKNGRDVSSSIMINEAEKALDKASGDSENMIVGFNPDPDLYKEVVSKLR